MDENSKIRMALIATYPEMSKLFLNIAHQKDVIPYDEYASFQDAVLMAKKLESQVDIILSRGGTAANISEAVSTPVVFIPITPFDVIQALNKLDAEVKEVALFHYTRKIYSIDYIENMYGIHIFEYTFDTLDDIRKNVEIVCARGLKVIIGGQESVRLARAAGLQGVELSAGEDTVNRAVEEGIQIVNGFRGAHYQAARLHAAFDAISEGVVVTDENRTILVCNSSAEKMLQKNYAIGDVFSDDKLNPSLTETERTRKAQGNYLHKISSFTVSINHFPVLRDERFLGVVSTLDDVTKIQRTEQNIRKQLSGKGFVAKYNFEDILTNNPKMKEIKRLAEMYATTDYAILIEGESGTGKELFAQSIHNSSRRANGPFVAVNCAAIPENLLESELFGYETGAFTGARKDGRSGLFEMASGGTIFLDEIAELPIQLQTRLLRVLQEKEIMRVGGSRIIPIDIRVISATNKKSRWMRDATHFRQDLYYRLNVLNVSIPALRKRYKDIELLCTQFYQKHKISIDVVRFRQLLLYMERYSWPGNVRELQNIAQRIAFLLMNSPHKEAKELVGILGFDEAISVKEDKAFAHPDTTEGLKKAVSQVEKEIIENMLEECDGDYNEAAARLKIGRTTLWRKMSPQDEHEENEDEEE